MKKKNSLIIKIFGIVLLALTITFAVINLISIRIVKEEVLNQLKVDSQKLVDSYVELMKAKNCTDISDYQAFVDHINSINALNYALYIEDINGTVTAVAHSNPDRIGLILEDAGSIAAARDGESYVGYYTDPVSGGLTLDVLTPVYDDTGSLQGALNLGIPVDKASLNVMITKAASRISLMSGGFSVFLLVVVCGFMYLLVIRPIRHLCVNIAKLSHYDLSDDSSGMMTRIENRKDEIGLIGKGFETMRTSLITLIGEIKSATTQLMDQSEELSDVSQRVADMGEQLSVSVSEVANGATSQAQATAEGQEQINQLSQVLEAVRTDMELLNNSTHNVHLIKEEGIEALKVVVANTENSQANSEKVHDVIMETSHQTDRIKAASSQIREIASQTNLLALNASIEAARAGDAGRGFAVVASEIGNLAGETNDLTAQIEEIVQDLVTKMELAVRTIDDMQQASAEQSTSVSQTQEKFYHISDNIKDMEDKCNHLNESTARMSESRNAIVSMISDLSAISEENAACMEEAAASVTEEAKELEKVSSASSQVAALAETLTSHVSSFITE